jgi:hypothetical protein
MGFTPCGQCEFMAVFPEQSERFEHIDDLGNRCSLILVLGISPRVSQPVLNFCD